jgi:hypothetical protein
MPVTKPRRVNVHEVKPKKRAIPISVFLFLKTASIKRKMKMYPKMDSGG